MTTESESEVVGWFRGRIREDWFTDLDVRVDKDEILVIGTLPEPEVPDGEHHDTEHHVACSARINGFREDTRDQRIKIAVEAEHLFGRKVSWAATCGDVDRSFTVASVPVMTRLRMDQRRVLDTLIDAGIARSRSEALAWCVKLVGDNQSEWIDALREALSAVEEARAQGPSVG